MSRKLVIASRESALAMWQAQYIQNKLLEIYPDYLIEILGMTTKGDQITDRPLQDIGGKGLFIKELEIALQQNKADLAVHSLKDVPMDLPDGFMLAAFPQRELQNDAFVSNEYASLDDLPENSLVGTSSQRRQALLQQYYPHLRIEALRGNLQTRLNKLDQGQYAAIILAAAGLLRLGLESRIKLILPLEQFIPAPGQGALAIEILSERHDLVELLRPLDHFPTNMAVRAEREFSRSLGGSCQVAIGAQAEYSNESLKLSGFYVDQGKFLQGEIFASKLENDYRNPENIGINLVQQLQAKK